MTDHHPTGNEQQAASGIEEMASEPFCPAFHAAIELIGRRWTGAVLRAMFAGATRFSDIAATVPGLSDRLLAERLRELEDRGIVARNVIPDRPVRIEYRLTERGRDLEPVMESVSVWANRWLAEELAERA
jgi:DNA-binding HxlR family transcriptional regulator